MSRDARERMAAAQARVVRALVVDGEVPVGFDRRHFDNARQVVADKQARMAARRARRLRAESGWGAATRPGPWWRRLVERIRLRHK